jgi:hypothetical protein
MRAFTRWSEASTRTKILQVVMALLVFTILVNLVPAAFAAERHVHRQRISGQAVRVQTVQASASTVCWAWTKNPPFTSSTSLGARANWSATLQWCGNDRTADNGGKVTALQQKRCFDWGGGFFHFEDVVECSRSVLGQPSLRINENLRYEKVDWIAPGISVTTVRFAHASIVLGPRGGVSGESWWSS